MRIVIVASACVLAAALAACRDPSSPPGGAAAPAATPDATEAKPTEPQVPRDLTTPPVVAWTTKGAGPALQAGDTVLIHLLGTVTKDGHVFADTRKADAPIPHRVGSGHLVLGLDLVFPQLRVGDRVTTTLRSDLAYGERGVPFVVPEKAEVTFDVEVLSLVEPPKWDVITKGEGREAKAGTLASIHYVGTLPDGKPFDSSRERGQPYQFRVGLGEVIEGMDYVVARMRVGDRWKVVIPWVFAYGTDGAPPAVPPKADLTFDLEVVRVDD